MKILVFIINIVILVAIEVGNFFVFYISALSKLLKIITAGFRKNLFQSKKILLKTKIKNKKLISSRIKDIKDNIEIFRFKASLSFKKLKRRNNLKRKNKLITRTEKKENTIIIFPIPKHRLLKVKY